MAQAWLLEVAPAAPAAPAASSAKAAAEIELAAALEAEERWRRRDAEKS